MLIINILVLLRFFRSVFRARFFAVFDRCAVEGASDNVVSHAGEVFDPAAADEYDAVLLQIVPLSRDISDDFLAIGQSDPCDLSQG